MKNKKGITLPSLIVYIGLLTATLLLLVKMISGIRPVTEMIDGDTIKNLQVMKLNTALYKDAQESDDAYVEKESNGDLRLIFKNNTNYYYDKQRKAVYRNQVQLTNKVQVDNIVVEQRGRSSKRKKIVRVETPRYKTRAGQKDIYEVKDNEFVLKYW